VQVLLRKWRGGPREIGSRKGGGGGGKEGPAELQERTHPRLGKRTSKPIGKGGIEGRQEPHWGEEKRERKENIMEWRSRALCQASDHLFRKWKGEGSKEKYSRVGEGKGEGKRLGKAASTNHSRGAG